MVKTSPTPAVDQTPIQPNVPVRGGFRQASASVGPTKLSAVVIPVGGLGTRMYPVTKGNPKNLIDLNNKPVIELAVEEANRAGADKIIIVTSPRQEAVYRETFFPSDELRAALSKKPDLKFHLDQIDAYARKIQFVVQTEPKGLGHAVLQAKPFVGKGSFGVILPDDPILDNNLNPVGLQSMLSHYKGGISVARQAMAPEEVRRYGVFDFGKPASALNNIGISEPIAGMVEKPQGDIPSSFVVMGRYILPPEIFEELEKGIVGAGDEIQLTDAMVELMKKGVPAYATEFSGTRFDCGTPEGLRTARNRVEQLQQKLDAKRALSGPKLIL